MANESGWDSPIPANWEGVHKARLLVPGGPDGVRYYHHAKKLIKLDSAILDELLSALEGELEVYCNVRDEKIKRRGISPKTLNDYIRTRLAQGAGDGKTSPWTFEAKVENGIIYDRTNWKKAKREGFDLARHDWKHNIAAFHELCFGRRPVRDGEDLWTKEREKRAHWQTLMEEFQEGHVASTEKELPTVLGEIQFGVTTQLDHDLLRLLQARADLMRTEDEIDLYVYICPTGILSDGLSSNTVTADGVQANLRALGAVLPIPTIVIPVDLEMDPSGGGRIRDLDSKELAAAKAAQHKRAAHAASLGQPA